MITSRTIRFMVLERILDLEATLTSEQLAGTHVAIAPSSRSPIFEATICNELVQGEGRWRFVLSLCWRGHGHKTTASERQRKTSQPGE